MKLICGSPKGSEYEMNRYACVFGLSNGSDKDGLRKGDRARDAEIESERKREREAKKGRCRELVWPHDLHIGVILSFEEVIAAVRSHHIFINRELDFPPELAVLLWAHGQSETHQKDPSRKVSQHEKENWTWNFLGCETLRRQEQVSLESSSTISRDMACN